MIAWIFPGQGSQRLGMAGGLTSARARATFEEASAVLGWDVLALCTEGPAARLDATEITQPAVFTAAVAAARTLEALGLRPDAVAGHSVGEYAALVAAGAVGFEDALRAVAVRARSMRDAGRERAGGMAAVIGLGPERIDALCGAVPGVVGPANVNAPDQIVISGEDDALMEVASRARAEGARVIRLKVSVAAHSALMRPAQDALAAELARARWAAPEPAFVSCVTGAVEDRPDALAGLLVRGVTEPVRWVTTVETLSHLGVDVFVELGCGDVLSRLVRRTVPDARTEQVEDDASAAELAGRLASVRTEGGSAGHGD